MIIEFQWQHQNFKSGGGGGKVLIRAGGQNNFRLTRCAQSANHKGVSVKRNTKLVMGAWAELLPAAEGLGQ